MTNKAKKKTASNDKPEWRLEHILAIVAIFVMIAIFLIKQRRSLPVAVLSARFYTGPPSRSFGVQTRAAVIRFQKAHNLLADGIVGEETWPALENAYIEYRLEQLHNHKKGLTIRTIFEDT